MSTSFVPRLDILPTAQRELWPDLRGLNTLGMVLHGGTAIALRLGHRVSVDFDFFASDPLDRAALRRALPVLQNATVLQDEANALTVLAPTASQPVKLSFFGTVDFGRIGEPGWTADGVALVASPADLLAQKLKVVMQRIEAKDYRDIAALLRSGLSLESGLAGALGLFGPAFSAAECAKALVHFRGGDLDTVPAGDREILLHAVRHFPDQLRATPRISARLT